MASSNRHWPSMFKSKPCNHHQWQHDMNSSILPSCHRSPYSSGCEERSPEPKPRWNPKPEQIRILETIFNSGMVNPPREEIRKIRAQLQEYGQVGDANVFYWFQNRKSRSKHKNRHLDKNSKTHSQTSPNPNPNPTVATPISTAVAVSIPVTASSSSSSSDKTTTPKIFSVGSGNVNELSNSPTGSVNQQQNNYFTASGEFFPEAFFFPMQNQNQQQQVIGGGLFGFPEMENVSNVSSGGDLTVGNNSGLLLTELMMMNDTNHKKCDEENEKMNHNNLYSFNSPIVPPSLDLPTSVTTIGGLGEHGLFTPARSTVFINDVAFEVAVGPFNVREAFGDDAVLIHSSGQTVVTNEWGVTLRSLQHGAFYYLVRTLASSHGYTFDLIW